MARQFLLEAVFDYDEGQEYETATTETPTGTEVLDVSRRYIEDGIDVAARPLCNSCASLDLQPADFTLSSAKNNQTVTPGGGPHSTKQCILSYPIATDSTNF